MDGGKVAEDVSFMSQSRYFAYADIKELDATAVQLPFKDPPMEGSPHYARSDVYMLLILPNSKRTVRGGFSAFEEKLKRVNFDKILQQFRCLRVNLKIPKFKIETDVKPEILKEALMKMGMRQLFTDHPDFSNLLERKLFPMKNAIEVVHKAFIEIDEKGAEATAFTMLSMLFGANVTVPVDFTADHPFLFAIMKKNKIMFLGRVSEF